jgi:lipopolysaccharide biosynthesis protein
MKARAIAFYVSQYHPVAENYSFWGKGFTEWANITKAGPLFRGHQQPFLPSALGFYDLRVPEVREQQAQLAIKAGIEGFCSWQYWFGNGERVLERIFDDFVETGSPNILFCMGWVNENWIGKWHGLEIITFFKKKNPGIDAHTDHFGYLLPASRESRYMKVTSD